MTTWVEPSGGRRFGPLGLLQAWVQVLVHPWAFFEDAVSTGDQGPGLAFAMAVVLVEESTRLLLVPDARPMVDGSGVTGSILFIALVSFLVTPLALHAFAAIETLMLQLAPTRAGISETVQVLAYASAPCVIVGVPIPEIRVIGGLWTLALLVIGFHVVHNLRYIMAAVLAVPAGILGIGYGFRWFGALLEAVPVLGDLIPW